MTSLWLPLTILQDGNTGLINQALERAPRRLIKKLTSTYLTLGLAEIGKNVRISEVEEVRALVLKMVGLEHRSSLSILS